jgi:hypothetical protein
MGYNSTVNYGGAISGGQGNPESWDIITDTACDLGGKIVGAFESLDENGGTFDAMEEQTSRLRGNQPAVSEAVAAKYLTYTYPKNILFTGRYTKLTPGRGCLFIVYFLK